jgi:hypothetical protein
MRKFSAAVKELMLGDELTLFYLLAFKSGSTDIKHTTLPYDVTISGLGTFSSENDLLAVEAPKLSSVVDREAYKITYADPQFDWRTIFEMGLQGALVTVHIGFINTTNVSLNGTAPGRPLLGIADLVVAYRGFVDTQGHTTSAESEVKAVIECSSPMADLGLVRSILSTKDAQRQRAADDSAFDQVYSGAKSVDFLWGKIR